MRKQLLIFVLCFSFGSSFAQIERMVSLQKLKHQVMKDAYIHRDDANIVKRLDPQKVNNMNAAVQAVADLKSAHDAAALKLTSSQSEAEKKAIADYENAQNAAAQATVNATNSAANSNNGGISPSPTLTLPNTITGNSGNINYVPAVNILGGYTYVGSSMATDGSLNSGPMFSLNSNIFTSGIPQFTSAKQVFDSYWTPEASTFGINFNVNLGCSLSKNSKNNLNARIQADILGKKLASFDSLSGKNANKATCTSTHVKVGLEYMPFSDYLTLYFNYDMIYAITNVDTFQTYFSLKSDKPYSFVDFGVRVPYSFPALNISGGKSAGVQSGSQATTSIFVDLNFVPIMGNMSQLFSGNSDKLILNFKVGFIESFGINSNPQAAKKPSGSL